MGLFHLIVRSRISILTVLISKLSLKAGHELMVHKLLCSCWEVKLKYVSGEEKLFVSHSSFQERTFILDVVWLL